MPGMQSVTALLPFALTESLMWCEAGLLGFVFIKAWVAVGTKLGLKMQPFTAQENTVIQTTCVSCYGLAFYGGFATYLFSMTPKIQQVLGDNPGKLNLGFSKSASCISAQQSPTCSGW